MSDGKTKMRMQQGIEYDKEGEVEHVRREETKKKRDSEDEAIERFWFILALDF